jgi:vancomycin resistance protein VanJ
VEWGAGLWWASLLALLPPQLIAPLPLVVLLLAIRRRHWTLLVANLAVLGLVGWAAGFNIPSARLPPGPSLRLVSFNTDRGAAGAARVAEVLKSLRPDLIALQETRPRSGDFTADLIRRFPGWQAARYDELLILSKFPIRRRQVVPFPNSPHALLQVVLEVRGRPLTLIDTHLETVGALASPSDVWRGRSLMVRTERKNVIRRDGVQLMLRQARQTRGPLLIAGDFNLPPRGPLYAALSADLTDAFVVRGWGFGFTHAARLPHSRIDHVWLSGARAARVFAAPVVASDHRPLVLDLAWPQTARP